MTRFTALRLVLATGLSLLVVAPVAAASSSANISHAYKTHSTISQGSLVSLSSSDASYVEAATTQNGSRLAGIIVPKDDSLISEDGAADTVQVASTGTVTAYASTLNGKIAIGDQIAVSPFAGIGDKATGGGQVIGTARTALTTDTEGTTEQTVTDTNGVKRIISVGTIRLSVGVGTSTAPSTSSQHGLQEAAKSLTGHSISTARIVISMVVALVAFISIVTLMYSSIYGGIISIGRNPLAKYAVFRTVGSVLAMVVIMGIVAAAIIVLLLS